MSGWPGRSAALSSPRLTACAPPTGPPSTGRPAVRWAAITSAMKLLTAPPLHFNSTLIVPMLHLEPHWVGRRCSKFVAQKCSSPQAAQRC